MARTFVCCGMTLLICVLGPGSASGAAERRVVDAAKRGDSGAIRSLIAQRVDVNAAEPDGTTALFYAADRGDVEAVDLLLAAHADAKVVNRYGVSALSVASVNGGAAIIERLLKAGADANTAMPGGETVLMTAARAGTPETIRALVAHGANVNAKENVRGQTALMWASIENNVPVIRELIKAGADIRARAQEPAGNFVHSDVMGFQTADQFQKGAKASLTPLLFAVRQGSREAAQALLDAGADVNEVAADGSGTVVIALINAHYELADLLLDRGAEINASKSGWTPLHQVVRTRRLNIGNLPAPVATGTLSSLAFARKLVARGANVNARMTKEFHDYYRNRMKRVGATPLLLASKTADVEMMRLLLESGADPMIGTEEGTTPLMVSSGVGISVPGEDDGGEGAPVLEAVAMLLERDKNVTATNAKGETALHGAAKRGNVELIQILVGKGAKLDARTFPGKISSPWTPKEGLLPLEFAQGKNETVRRVSPKAVVLMKQMMVERGIALPSDLVDYGIIEKK